MNVGSIDLRPLPHRGEREQSSVPPALKGLARDLAEAGETFTLLGAEDVSRRSLNCFDALVVLGPGAGRDLREAAGAKAVLVLWCEETDTARRSRALNEAAGWNAVAHSDHPPEEGWVSWLRRLCDGRPTRA